MNQLEQTLTSLEVAEMMEVKHYQILEKLEGTKTVKGIIPTMTNHKIMVSEYFAHSTYQDASGKENKCYLITKLGCDFLANKFTGEKGILFTAKYVKRFKDMEDKINQFILPQTYRDALQQLLISIDEKEQLETEVKVKNQLIGELKPKADYMDQILNNKGLVTITQIAKDYGMSGQAMNELLHSLKVQYKQSEQWLLYSKYHDLGYTHSKTVDIVRSSGMADIKMNTKWTQKGRLFLYELLKSNNYLPVIEQNKTA